MHGRSMDSTQNSGNLVLSMVKTPIQQQQEDGDLSGQGEVEVIFTDFSLVIFVQRWNLSFILIIFYIEKCFFLRLETLCDDLSVLK